MAVIGTDSRTAAPPGPRAPAAPDTGRRVTDRRRPRRADSDPGAQLVHHLQPGRAVQQQPGGHDPGPGRGDPGGGGAPGSRARPGQAAARPVLGTGCRRPCAATSGSPTSPRYRCRRASPSGCPSTCRSPSGAVILAVLIGGTAGTVAAVRRGGWFDRGVTLVVLGGLDAAGLRGRDHPGRPVRGGRARAAGQRLRRARPRASARGSRTSSCRAWRWPCRSPRTSPGSCGPRWSPCSSRTTSPAPGSGACRTAGS